MSICVTSQKNVCVNGYIWTGLGKLPYHPPARFLNPAPPLLRRPRNGTLEKSEKAQTYLFGWPLGSISPVSRVRSLILPEANRDFRGMSAGSFSRTAAGNRA